MANRWQRVGTVLRCVNPWEFGQLSSVGDDAVPPPVPGDYGVIVHIPKVSLIHVLHVRGHGVVAWHGSYVTESRSNRVVRCYWRVVPEGEVPDEVLVAFTRYMLTQGAPT